MFELPPQDDISETLLQKRLLTEVDQLLLHRLSDGTFDSAAEQDIRTNLMTAVQEIAMPYAVTTTVQRASEELDEHGRLQRVFKWLGKSAIDVAESGYQYHFSEPAFARVRVEVEEARHTQEATRAGAMQVFISPEMSDFDAPNAVAEQEHLLGDDAVRTTCVITDNQGHIVGLRLQSLLVRDVPLSAWVAMLQDPGNVFNTAFDIRDERSALSVMELFKQFELPEDALPEGPVSLIGAVLPYISDELARASVEGQIMGFRSDQELYRTTAEAKAEEWITFEKELANSLFAGQATFEVKRFIITLQRQWGSEDLFLIDNHQLGDGEYLMTRKLAARLEKAKQNILNSIAAIQTGNDKVLSQVDPKAVQSLQEEVRSIETLRAGGMPQAELEQRIANLNRRVAEQNFDVGGGCPGRNKGEFNNSLLGPDTEENAIGSSADKNNWNWKSGVCRVKSCLSPKPTEVGPCSVCRSCQRKFDQGQDPTKLPSPPRSPKSTLSVQSLEKLSHPSWRLEERLVKRETVRPTKTSDPDRSYAVGKLTLVDIF